ncbi:ribosome production factor 2 homolog [Liolophura sinensis]|uniref:ribosome production factor 2 homolog n=1 Tax=Liolophura sinensis TaxID=3198878 RepID=UPI003159436C
MVLQRIVKAKTQAGKRYLQRREAKIHENVKSAMLIRGGNTSQTVTQAMKEIHLLKKPYASLFKRKNPLKPFEDQTSIEFFSDRNDASLFLFGSHSKKRPHNLVIGRLFDYHILDMVELGIDKFTSMSDFKVAKCAQGAKPCLVFAGEPFEQDHEYQRIKNLFIDFFRGPVVQKLRLAGLEHVISFTAAEGKIFMRTYRTHLLKSGSRTPRVEVEEMGPSMDFSVRRTKLASDDLFKRATRQPKQAKPKKRKNVSHDPFGTKMGRIHMEKQDMDKLQLRKMKALKRKSKSEEGDTTLSSPKKSKDNENVQGEVSD